MKVVVTGSRRWSDMGVIRAAIDRLPDRSTVIVGGALGADTEAEGAARLRGHTVIVMRAAWAVSARTPRERIRRRPDGSTYDSGAGFERNLRMLDERPDLVLAFWRGRSSGTRHTIGEAMKRDIPLELHWRPE